MISELQDKINQCRLCEGNPYVTFEKPEVFIGGEKSLKVMLIGHSPTVRTFVEADVVLKMDKKNQPLYQYIKKEILEPLGIDEEELYCTNAIKCKTVEVPEEICKDDQFFDCTFAHCKGLLQQEIEEIKPQLIISLSERVLRLLTKEYGNEVVRMKDHFGKMHTLHIGGQEYRYIPLVHLPKGRNSAVAKYYFPEQTLRLRQLKDQWRDS